MKRAVFLIRFFHVVPPVPPSMKWALAAAVLAGGVALALGATDMRGVLAPMFLLQTFAASSGFAVPARRGHYDLLLTSGVPRVGIAAAHLVASLAPGVVCLGGMIAMEWLVGGTAPVSTASGTAAALAIISALSWAVTVPLPRLTGAVVWLVVLASPLHGGAMPLVLRPLGMPWALVGADIATAGPLGAGIATFAVVVSVASAMAWICRTDVSLQVAR